MSVFSAHPDVRTSVHLQIRKSGPLDLRASTYPDVRMFAKSSNLHTHMLRFCVSALYSLHKCVDLRTSEHPDMRLLGGPEVRIYGFADAQMPGRPDVQ